jgi:hypothetical protein
MAAVNALPNSLRRQFLTTQTGDCTSHAARLFVIITFPNSIADSPRSAASILDLPLAAHDRPIDLRLLWATILPTFRLQQSGEIELKCGSASCGKDPFC